MQTDRERSVYYLQKNSLKVETALFVEWKKKIAQFERCTLLMFEKKERENRKNMKK